MEPLNFETCRKEFLKFPVSDLFIEKLTYLSEDEEFRRNAFVLSSRDNVANNEKSLETIELDLEMSRIVGQELESRKLDRLKAQTSDVYLPLSGLMQRQGSAANNGPTSPSILLKKKKKFVIKSLKLPLR